MSRKAENLIVWAAVVIGGGYLIYRLFNQPALTATTGGIPTTGANPAAGSIQANLDTALTNIATGVTGIVGG